MTRIHGIDISHWNRVYDWPAVAGAVGWVYLKATEADLWVDPRFAEYWRDAGLAGLRRGAYHFYRADVPGVRQAQHFARTLAGDLGELAPAVDVETGDGVGPAALTGNLWALLAELEVLTGVRPVIYSSATAWNALTTRPTWAADYEWWLAHYNSAISAPALPAHVATWKIWQYTKGSVPGIAGDVDLDRDRVTNTIIVVVP